MEEYENTEVRKPNPVFRAFRFLWNLLKGYFMMIGLMVTLLPILLVIVISRSSTPVDVSVSDVEIDKDTVVEIVLDGELMEKSADPSMQFFMQLFGETSGLFAPEFNNPLEYAAKNEKVKAVFIDMRNLSGSLSQLSELRRALKQVKDVGKPLYVHASDLNNASFYIASLADEIVLTPAGNVGVTGPVLSLMYFADGLKKLGVEFEVFQAGKFKSAMENLVRNEPSGPAREMYESLEQSLRQQLIEEISSGRGVDVGLARGWLSQSYFVPNDAVQAGIVNKLQYKEQFKNELKEKYKVEELMKFSSFKAAAITAMSQENMTASTEGIALIEAVGEIHLSFDGGRSDEVITPKTVNKKLKWARESEDVKAVVLRISSPGGSATASDMIWNQVRLTAEKKPVVVSMGAYAASGGYYIASGATKILSDAMTITGSIGVIGGIANLADFKEKYGVHFHTITGSERESILNPGKKMTSFDRALFDASIKSVYRDFLERVAEGRKMSVEDVHKVAQGRVFTGRDALRYKLVDDIGGFKEAFRVAKELSGLDPNRKYPVLKYKKDDLSFKECLQNQRSLFRCLRELESSVGSPLGAILSSQRVSIAPGLSLDSHEIAKTWSLLKEKKPMTLMPVKPVAVND